MRLELVECGLDLPSIVVERAELLGGCLRGVENRGDQPVVGFWISDALESVVYDAHHATLVSMPARRGRGVEGAEVRAIGQVAIKVLPPDLTRDDTAKRRFLQEAKAASALDHPNVCTIHKINETADGQLYLVMAYYERETLKQRIERGPLGLDDAVDIETQVGRGLAEAHGAGIVHRDIKPRPI